MEEKIQIDKAIVHILYQKKAHILSDVELDLDEGISSLISDHIDRAFNSQGRVFAKFVTEENEVKNASMKIFEDDKMFISQSKNISRKLYKAMSTKNASSGNLLIVKYTDKGRSYLAIIKLDFSENYQTEKIEEDGVTKVRFKLTKDGFSKSDKLRKCAILDDSIIHDSEAKILVLDTDKKDDVTGYFKDDFLGTELINNNKINTRNMIREITNFINEKYENDFPEMLEKTFALTNILSSQLDFKLDEVLPAIFIDENIQDEFKSRVEKKNIDFTFKIDRESVSKRLKNRSITTSNGISLQGKASLFSSNDIKIEEREDGLWDITIKGVSIEKNKV